MYPSLTLSTYISVSNTMLQSVTRILSHILLLILLIHKSHAKHAKHVGKTGNSLVMGLTHSITFSHRSPEPQDNLDILEPLREFRDGYLISLNLGTPPQVLPVYMDTGSDLTWVPCGNVSFDCLDCDDFRNYKLVASYSPSRSSTSLRELCNSAHCTDIHSSDNFYDPCIVAGCSLVTLIKGTCPRPCPAFAYTYGAGGVVTGTLTRDILKIHGSGSSHSSIANTLRDISNFRFGCVGSTYREPIGIVGFGKGPLSLPSQLGFLQKGFSHCFLSFKFANNPNISSPLLMGDLAISFKDHLQYTPMLKSPMYPNYYYIGLEAISVLGINGSNLISQVPLSLRAFDNQGNGGMVIDSGTTYTHLPDPLYTQLLAMITSMVSYSRSIEHEQRTGFDLCYEVPCPINSCSNTAINDGLPSISLYFLNNVTLVLPKENSFYAMGAPVNSRVVKCLLFQSMEDGGYGPAGVFGNFQQQNIEVVYDLEQEKIGFQPMDCASSAASHGLHGN